MLHKIDSRDHGLFTPQHHELTFLTFPTIIYRWVTRHSGRPNRVLFHRYRERLERLKEKGLIDYSIHVTRLTGVGDIIPHQRYEDVTATVWRQATQSIEQCRPLFASEFVQVESRDLAVGGVFLTALRR